MCFNSRAERQRPFGPANVFGSQLDLDNIEDFSSLLPRSSPSASKTFEVVTDEYMLAAATNVMSDTCKKGNMYPALCVVVDKFENLGQSITLRRCCI